MYEGTAASVKKGPITTDTFSTQRGIIQGCPLSPQLFNVFLDKVMEQALGNIDGGILIGGERISYLRYPDDIVLLGKTIEYR